MAPSYLAELLTHYSPAHSLRSSDKALLGIPWSTLKTKDDRAFAVRTPTRWNSLPEELRLVCPLLNHLSRLILITWLFLNNFMLLMLSVLLSVLLSIILSLLSAVLFILVMC